MPVTISLLIGLCHKKNRYKYWSVDLRHYTAHLAANRKCICKSGPHHVCRVLHYFFYIFIFIFKNYFTFFTKQLRLIVDNINVNKNITMSIIKSIKQTDFTTIITTKSNIVKVYKFKTKKENNEYFQQYFTKQSIKRFSQM